MCRDSIKNKKYFDDYIAYQNKRIESFTKDRDALGNDQVDERKNYSSTIAGFYKDLFSAEYSVGASANELRSVFEKYLENLKICGLESYDDTIDVLSLVFLFGIDYGQISSIDTAKYIDALTDKLLSVITRDETDSANLELLYPEQYQVFYNYATGAIPFEEFLDYMKNDWYATNEEKSWYNAHLRKNDTYVGYWCWLAAALMKIRGDKTDKMEYVPVDLI